MTSKTRSDCTGKMCFTVARWRVNEYKFCLSRWVVHGCEAEGNNFELLGAETLCHVSPFLVLVCDIENAMQRVVNDRGVWESVVTCVLPLILKRGMNFLKKLRCL